MVRGNMWAHTEERRCIMDCENYYCLATDGLLYALGNHGDYEAANATAESLGLEIIWLFGESTRDSWCDSLNSFIEGEK